MTAANVASLAESTQKIIRSAKLECAPNCRRAELHCFGAFIEATQTKVADFEIVERRQPSKPENFMESSEAMESEVLR
jgi:hypothetical protein